MNAFRIKILSGYDLYEWSLGWFLDIIFLKITGDFVQLTIFSYCNFNVPELL